MKKLYTVDLNEVERTQLLADDGKTDTEIAAALHIGPATVARTR